MRTREPKVTRSLALAVRADYKRGASMVELSALHDIAHGTVSVIVRGVHYWTQGMVNLSAGRGRRCNHVNPVYGISRCSGLRCNPYS